MIEPDLGGDVILTLHQAFNEFSQSFQLKSDNSSQQAREIGRNMKSATSILEVPDVSTLIRDIASKDPQLAANVVISESNT
jgi:hypothetical protein